MSGLVQFLNSVCLPAKIYLGLILTNFFIMLFLKKDKKSVKFIISVFIILLLIGLAITWFGNYLCSQGFEFVTWLFVILPLMHLLDNVRKLWK
jgi:hypothetical protein